MRGKKKKKIFFLACGSSRAKDRICATAVTTTDPEPAEMPGNSKKRYFVKWKKKSRSRTLYCMLPFTSGGRGHREIGLHGHKNISEGSTRNWWNWMLWGRGSGWLRTRADRRLPSHTLWYLLNFEPCKYMMCSKNKWTKWKLRHKLGSSGCDSVG